MTICTRLLLSRLRYGYVIYAVTSGHAHHITLSPADRHTCRRQTDTHVSLPADQPLRMPWSASVISAVPSRADCTRHCDRHPFPPSSLQTDIPFLRPLLRQSSVSSVFPADSPPFPSSSLQTQSPDTSLFPAVIRFLPFSLQSFVSPPGPEVRICSSPMQLVTVAQSARCGHSVSYVRHSDCGHSVSYVRHSDTVSSLRSLGVICSSQ